MTEPFRIVPAGDSVLVVEFEEQIDPAVNAQVVRLAETIAYAGVAGVRDIVPTYRSVAIYVDPLRFDRQQFVTWLEREAPKSAEVREEPRAPIPVPVCYGGDLGPDLEVVARFGQMSLKDIAAIHAGRTYRVFMLGFLPGFAYMGVVDPRIAAPRRPTPRLRVPRGSVGIAGEQTGIYPVDAAGGWQIIGRTPLNPFDLARPTPFLFGAGDMVQFVPIDRSEYDRLVGETGRAVGADRAPARERRGAYRGPRERPSRGLGRSPM